MLKKIGIIGAGFVGQAWAKLFKLNFKSCFIIHKIKEYLNNNINKLIIKQNLSNNYKNGY